MGSPEVDFTPVLAESCDRRECDGQEDERTMDARRPLLLYEQNHRLARLRPLPPRFLPAKVVKDESTIRARNSRGNGSSALGANVEPEQE